jgi:hypothetical protein
MRDKDMMRVPDAREVKTHRHHVREGMSSCARARTRLQGCVQDAALDGTPSIGDG